MQSKNNRKLAQLENLAQLLNGAKFLRFIFFFYAFLGFIFWFLNCLDVDWLYLFAPLFQVPYQMVSKFYKPHGVGMSADFSLAIIGAVSLLIGLAFDFIINNAYYSILDKIEEEEKRIKKQTRKKTYRKTFSQNNIQNNNYASDNLSEISNSGSLLENSKLLFIIAPHLNKIKKKQEDLELTFQEVEIWKQRINKRLIENFIYSKPLQKGYYRKNLFLLYKDFNYVDDFIYYISPTIDSIILEFKKYGIKIAFCYVLSTISQAGALEKELDCMDTILALNFFGEFITTNRFKITYDYKPIHKYTMELKGEYNLSKNLSITNKQMLYKIVKEISDENESNKA